MAVFDADPATVRPALYDFFSGPEENHPDGLVADLHRIAELGDANGLHLLMEQARRRGVGEPDLRGIYAGGGHVPPPPPGSRQDLGTPNTVRALRIARSSRLSSQSICRPIARAHNQLCCEDSAGCCGYPLQAVTCHRTSGAPFRRLPGAARSAKGQAFRRKVWQEPPPARRKGRSPPARPQS